MIVERQAEQTAESLRNLLATHLPSAAIASGWISPVDLSAWIDTVSERFPLDARPENLGLSALIAWLADRGIVAGADAVRALRLRWLFAEMVDASRRGAGVVVEGRR